MKAWQIFGVGAAVLVAALLLPSYERILAGLADCNGRGSGGGFLRHRDTLIAERLEGFRRELCPLQFLQQQHIRFANF